MVKISSQASIDSDVFIENTNEDSYASPRMPKKDIDSDQDFEDGGNGLNGDSPVKTK